MIYAFVGYMGSGKTTIARAALTGRTNWQHIGFSDPMIEMMRVLGVPDSIISDKARWNDPLDVLNARTLRHATQTIGTEWGREHMGQDFWLNHGLTRARNFKGNTFIDNVRFPNEARAITKAGGILIALHRRESVPLCGVTHTSEQHIAFIQGEMCDFHIYNDDAPMHAITQLETILGL